MAGGSREKGALLIQERPFFVAGPLLFRISLKLLEPKGFSRVIRVGQPPAETVAKP